MEQESYTIKFKEQPMDCDISPTAELLVAGVVDGVVTGFSLPTAEEISGSRQQDLPATNTTFSANLAAGTCRAVRFFANGSQLVAGSADGSLQLVDPAAGLCSTSFQGAHDEAISTLADVGGGLFASGDDGGVVKLWDGRSKSAVATFSKHSDFVADMALHAAEKCLLAVSGDGTLSVMDLGTRKVRARSEEDADDELLSVVVAKKGRKVVTGSQSGALALYSWGYFKDCSDRYPGHPESIDAIALFDDDTILTGSSDGAIRIVGLLPNKLLGVLGAHADLPIERLVLNASRRLLASVSHDEGIKLWDLACLHDEEGAGEEEGGEDEDESEEEEEGGVAGASRRRSREVAGQDDDDDVAGADDDASDGVGDEEPGSGDVADEDEDEEGGGIEMSDDMSDEDEGGREGAEEEGEEEEEEELEEAGGALALARPGAPHPAVPPGPKIRGGAAAAGAGASRVPAASKPDGDSDGEEEDSDGDSDDEPAGQSKKRKKHEKTKWSNAAAKTKQKSNFFADLL